LVAAAIPLVGASTASATLAGANPFTSTTRPDLVSATITGASSASFCFSKTVTSIADVGGFYLGGYRADRTAKSLNATTTGGNCVNAQVTTSPWFTFAQVGEGAVRTTGNIGNRSDSVALSGSNTGNGTRGLTVAPDLQGISIVSGAAQQIAFTYDEPVSSSAVVGAGGFHFVTSGGQPSCPSTVPACDVASNTAAISATDPRTVIAQFPVGGVPIVTSSVRAYNLPGAVTSAANGSPAGFDSAPAPSSSGVITGVPTLLSAQYSRQAGPACVPALSGGLAACVVVDYTFNEGVSVDQTTLANFIAYLSTDTTGTLSVQNPVAVTEPSGCTSATSGGLQGTPPCVGAPPGAGIAYGSTTVRAIFPLGLLSSDDYLVKAAVNGGQNTAELRAAAGGVTPFNAGCTNAGAPAGTLNLGNCAVVSTTTGHPNTVGSAPLGGNTGGKGAGFSAAPDPLFASFDTLTNTAAITLDSRAFATSTPGNVQLLAADGSEIAGATALSGCSPSTAGFPCALPVYGSAAPGSAGPVTVWAVFPSPAVQVGNAKALEIRGQLGSAFPFGFVWFNGLGTATLNLQDILAPAAVATANRHFAASSHWSHKRMTAKYQRSVLAKMKHHSRHSR